LPEWLLRRALLPAEATALGIRLARILQGFHEQGFIHGRLSAEWIMLHGELEPLLCPCGIPSQSIQARQKDLMALGRLLNEWLSPRPAKWQRQARADLYRVADAAAEGKYVRARSLADDLERADRAAQIRWRVRLGNILVLIFALTPLLVCAVERFWAESPWFARHLLLLLSPSAALLGYTFGRSEIQSRRLRLRGWAVSKSWVAGAESLKPRQTSIEIDALTGVSKTQPRPPDPRSAGSYPRFRISDFGFRYWLLRGLAQLALLIIPVALFTALGFLARHVSSPAPGLSLLLASGALVGYWILGALVAGLVATAEWIRRTLRPEPSDLPPLE
jgi:hypothetical protein